MIRRNELKNYTDEGYFLADVWTTLKKEEYGHLGLPTKDEYYESYKQLFYLAFHVEKHGKSTIAFPHTPMRIFNNDMFEMKEEVKFPILTGSLATDRNGNFVSLESTTDPSQFHCIDKNAVRQIFLTPSTSHEDELKKILASQSILVATNLILATMKTRNNYPSIPIIKENLKGIRDFLHMMQDKKITAFLDLSSLSKEERLYDNDLCEKVKEEIKRLEKEFKKGCSNK